MIIVCTTVKEFQNQVNSHTILITARINRSILIGDHTLEIAINGR